MYVAQITVKNLDEATKIIRKLDKSISTKRDDMALRALNRAANVWNQNFLSEGQEVGGWRQLAERTIEDRERLGFGGAHPIMIRYNHLRELTAENLSRYRSPNGSWSKSDPQHGVIRVSLSTRQGRMEVVATGNKAMNQVRAKNRPPRPYWFVNTKVKRDVRSGVVDFLTDEVRRTGAI